MSVTMTFPDWGAGLMLALLAIDCVLTLIHIALRIILLRRDR